MNRVLASLLRVALVAGAAFALFKVLEGRAYAWVALPVVLGASAALSVGRAWWRRRSELDVDERTLRDPKRRDAALRVVRERAARLSVGSPEHARVSVSLAELLDAEGRADAAVRALDAVRLDSLGEADAAVVRHALAVSLLRAGDAARAREVLRAQRPSGDAELDLRIRLIAALADAEGNAAEAAHEAAREVQRDTRADEALRSEARLVEAAALDALGRRAEALSALEPLDDEVLSALAELSFPRIRGLAEALLAQRA